MDIWQWMQLESQVTQLGTQAQQDLEAVTSLIEIYEHIRGLPQSDRTPLYLYIEFQNHLGHVFTELPIGDSAANLQRAITCFQETLQFWTPQTAPLDYARIQANLGEAYSQLPTGDRAANLQQAITCFREALRFRTPEADPFDYVATQNNLGDAYQRLPTGNQATNLRQAIACYQESLRFLRPETAPLAYALTQRHLGEAYAWLPTGDRTANLQQAIACAQEALRFLTPETDPLDYAVTQYMLGGAYTKLLTGDRSANLQQAITCFREALRFLTSDIDPLIYARTQAGLGEAYGQLLAGDRTANLQQAIACYQEVLRFWTPETTPFDYAQTQNNLGVAYLDLPTGDRVANLQRAMACFREALRFVNPETTPLEYGLAQSNLGMSYGQLLTGDRIANLQQAIAYCREALRFLTPETAPLDYALTQSHLGFAYTQLLIGDRTANLQQAIVCFEEVLRFWMPETAPLDYAMTQNNLGRAYYDLPTGDRTANLQRAITCFEEVLRFLTPETAPFGYAMTQNNLGRAYYDLPTGDRAANLQRAIACHQEALRFSTPESAPVACRESNRDLANLYFIQKEWSAALHTYQAAIHAGELLYRTGLSAESKATEMTANTILYRHAAFSAVRCGERASAFTILEQGKTRLLSEALRLRIPRLVNVPNAVWTAYVDTATAVRTLQDMSTTLSERYSSQTHATAVHAVTVALESAITEVRVYAPDFLRIIDARVAQALLPDDTTCFVLFCITTQGSIGMLVTRLSQEVQVIELPTFTQTDLTHLLVEVGEDREVLGGWLVAYLREQTPTSNDVWQETMEQTLDTLGQRLLDPILSALPTDIEHLIFLPSGQLFLFPLHAVPLAGNRAERVGDRYLVSYAPSIEVLANTRARAMQEASPDLYAVINPEADSQLVFTPREGTAIATLFAHSTLDEGRTGTRQQVKTRVHGQTYLHFSCHGSYNWNDPAASGLDLADGRLTLAELQEGSIDLSTARLVTLSACETGMTDVIRGSAEEYVGVPAGFMLAGVPCVISSLWAVPDLSTALLMERFYHNHLKSGMGFAAALREAQRWVRRLKIGEVVEYAEQCYEQSGRKNATLWHYLRHYHTLAEQNANLCPFAHPYYWAAFTANGW